MFDEERYFEPGGEPVVFEVNGVRLGLNICEDLWGEQGPVEAGASAEQHGAAAHQRKVWRAEAPRLARAAGAQVLLVLNASPYHTRQHASRLAVARNRAAETGLAIVYANLIGGQDELVFDGASFALDAQGELTHQLPFFEEALDYVDIVDGVPQPGTRAPALSFEASVYGALCLGVRDYLGKNGFPGAILGMSGGIDSALTLAIACDALGADKVRAVMMPSQYTADISWIDSRDMVKRLGVRYDEIAIKPMFDAFLAALAGEFKGLPADATEENLQARIRGTLLMALSNKFGSIVLTTGNKSEMAVGYSTLYGDMAGGFAVIKDVAKTLVYRLAEYRNSLGEVIPRRIIERAPSAELRPGPDRPGQPAAVRGARRHHVGLHGAESDSGRDHRRRPARGGCAPGGRADQTKRIQAPPGAGRHTHHPARFRQGLALSDYLEVPGAIQGLARAAGEGRA